VHRGHLGKQFFEAFFQEPVERVALDTIQIGHGHDLSSSSKRVAASHVLTHTSVFTATTRRKRTTSETFFREVDQAEIATACSGVRDNNTCICLVPPLTQALRFATMRHDQGLAARGPGGCRFKVEGKRRASAAAVNSCRTISAAGVNNCPPQPALQATLFWTLDSAK
jgi:hypothetical protein